MFEKRVLDSDVSVPSTNPASLIPAAARAGLVSEEQVGVLHELRIARNRAVHGMHPIPAQDALWFMETTRKVLRTIHSKPVAKSAKDGLAA